MKDCRKSLTIKGLWRPARRKSLIVNDLGNHTSIKKPSPFRRARAYLTGSPF